jgi:hypothetical protein
MKRENSSFNLIETIKTEKKKNNNHHHNHHHHNHNAEEHFFSMIEWVDILCTFNPDVLFFGKLCQISNDIRRLIYKFIVYSKEMTNQWYITFSRDLSRLILLKNITFGLEKDESLSLLNMEENVPCFINTIGCCCNMISSFNTLIHVGYKIHNFMSWNEEEIIVLNLSKLYCNNKGVSSTILYGRTYIECTCYKEIFYWYFLAKAFNNRFDSELIEYENKQLLYNKNISTLSRFKTY